MNRNWPILVQVLRQPAVLDNLDLGRWDVLLRQARHAELMARVSWLASQQNILPALPPAVTRHLESARIVAESVARQVRWEVNRIQIALGHLDLPIILLKGAAYELADLPSSKGRTFFDLDIMVPKASLPEVEKALKWHGWFTAHHDSYDDRYYRQWMHEIPPLRHAARQTVLDVHHTIIPETAKLKPDAGSLFLAARKLPGRDGLSVLPPEDMVLHSATHLFCDGELEHGLRDLVDLDILFRYFGDDSGFWQRLRNRAAEQDLTRPLYYAQAYCKEILGTPIPDDDPGLKGNKPLGATVIAGLFTRALMPDHPSCDSRLTGLARLTLYLRSHYLRMPLHLLVPHLIRKAIKTDTESVPEPEAGK